MSWLWGILFGVLASLLGAHKLLTGEPGLYWGNVPIPAWTGWVQLPFGLWVLFLSVRALMRDRNKTRPVVNLAEEAARAEEELDAMYLREYGKLPEKSKQDS